MSDINAQNPKEFSQQVAKELEEMRDRASEMNSAVSIFMPILQGLSWNPARHNETSTIVFASNYG
ncbi:hypothetical protein ACQUW0_27065 [Ralstonia pseudosolanacearum]|uniref:hypothetical protein n=1 Tax=Ralstonia pseudosolanacearum TaxID=1310165 RepID=UPI003D16EBB4